jgi:hypothetical protein
MHRCKSFNFPITIVPVCHDWVKLDHMFFLEASISLEGFPVILNDTYHIDHDYRNKHDDQLFEKDRDIIAK